MRWTWNLQKTHWHSKKEIKTGSGYVAVIKSMKVDGFYGNLGFLFQNQTALEPFHAKLFWTTHSSSEKNVLY